MTRKAKKSPMEEILGSVQEMTQFFSDLVGYTADTKPQRAYRVRKAIEDWAMAKDLAGYCDELV